MVIKACASPIRSESEEKRAWQMANHGNVVKQEEGFPGLSCSSSSKERVEVVGGVLGCREYSPIVGNKAKVTVTFIAYAFCVARSVHRCGVVSACCRRPCGCFLGG